MDKWPLISESVAAARIDIHPTEEEPDRYIIHVAPGDSRMSLDLLRGTG
jgi:hypothetical protein